MSVRLYVPGSGMVDASAYRVQKAVKEQDERLLFARNTDTGQWCVYIQSERDAEPLPILGFNEIPSPELVLKELYKRDAWRRGNEILDEVNKRNEDRRKELDAAAAEGSAAAAEAFEWGFRQMGAAPHTKIFIPRGIS
jgi:hypothetical protein